MFHSLLRAASDNEMLQGKLSNLTVASATGRKRALTRPDYESGMLPENLVYVLESLSLVGPNKAVGYLPIRTVTHVLGLKIEGVIADAEARGLKAITLGPRQCCIKSGALYVFDQEALERILRGSSTILRDVGAPVDPQKFVRFIARNWFASDHPIMPVIRTAFADSVTAA